MASDELARAIAADYGVELSEVAARPPFVHGYLIEGVMSARDDGEVLAGANRIAVETDGGEWEVIGFADADLIAPGSYELSRLLRGQMWTGHAIGPASVGNRVMVLDDLPLSEALPAGWLGETIALRAYAGPA